MTSGKIAIAFMVVLMVFSYFPTSVSSGERVGETTRAEDLLVSSGKTVINTPAVYRNVIVNGTGRLEIQAPAVVSVEEKFIVNSPESTLEISGGTLTVSGGLFYVRAKYVKILDSPLIYVKNVTTPAPGASGASTRLYINTSGETSGRGVFIRNSTLKVEGEKGGDGSEGGLLGGAGGHSSLYISSQGHNIEIWESTINVFGGDGGDAGPVVSAQGGRGGDAQLEIHSGGDLVIDSSVINATAGDGGEPSSVARGGAGGIVNVYTISAGGYINVSTSGIVSLGGLRREVEPYSRESSRVYMSAGRGIDFDSRKPVDKKDQVLSRIQTQDITFRAPEGVNLHEVDTGDSSPLTDVSDCTIYIYWYLTVRVTDNFGKPLPSTRIRIYRGPDEVFPNEEFLTDEEGVWKGEIPSKIITIDPNSNVFLHYNLKAEVPGGAVGTYPDVSLRGNTSITMEVRLIDLEVTSIMGKTPYENMVVGGDVLIEGTTGMPPGVTRRVVEVQIAIDDDSHRYSAEDMSGDWSHWRYLWDTLQYSDGPHTINVFASDGTYEVVWSLPVVIDQSSVNHPPIINTTSLRNGEKIIRYKEDPVFSFWIRIVDIDGNSTLTLGREVTEVEINFIYVATGKTVHTSTIPVTSRKVGEWNVTVDWNTFDVNDFDKEIFPSGNYTLRIRARDDANAWSRPLEISIQLVKYIRPTPAIASVNNIAPQWDRVNEILFVQFKANNVKSLELVFNASESYDEDGTYYLAGDKRFYYKDLVFIWDFGDGTSPVRVEGSPEVRHKYHFTSDRTFTVNLTVIDADGLENTQYFQVRIDYVPPPKPPAGPLAQAFDVSIKMGGNADLTTGLLFAVFLGLLVLWYYYTERIIPKKMNIKAERDVEEVVKMYESLREKQAKAVEEEFKKGKIIKAEEEAGREVAPPEESPEEVEGEKGEESEEGTKTSETTPPPSKNPPAPPPPPPPPPKK